jgi:hypothetical protein
MAKYVQLSLIDSDHVNELSPVLSYDEHADYVREIFRDPRIGELCDGLMEILDADYDIEEDFHVLSTELIDRIVDGLEERVGEWSDDAQYKTRRLIDQLKEQRDTFAFDSSDSLLLSWSD